MSDPVFIVGCHVKNGHIKIDVLKRFSEKCFFQFFIEFMCDFWPSLYVYTQAQTKTENTHITNMYLSQTIITIQAINYEI